MVEVGVPDPRDCVFLLITALSDLLSGPRTKNVKLESMSCIYTGLMNSSLYLDLTFEAPCVPSSRAGNILNVFPGKPTVTSMQSGRSHSCV